MSVTPTPLAWDQGEDLVIKVDYAVDDTPVDLTGWSARMDIARPNATGTIVSLYTFNTVDGDEETVDEIEMGTDGIITITVPRSLTILEDEEGANPELHPIGNDLKKASSATYLYDLFIRSPDNRQTKIMEGQITVKRSVTKWL